MILINHHHELIHIFWGKFFWLVTLNADRFDHTLSWPWNAQSKQKPLFVRIMFTKSVMKHFSSLDSRFADMWLEFFSYCKDWRTIPLTHIKVKCIFCWTVHSTLSRNFQILPCNFKQVLNLDSNLQM